VNGLQILLVVIGAVAVTAFAQRLELEPPLVITAVGLGVSFIPGVPRLQIEPELMLGVVVPPLLYATALDASIVAFLRKLWPILGLGVGLVVVTAVVVRFVGDAVMGGLTLTTALVLGAVISPSDAVSAVAIGRALGLRKPVLTLLTGESLVNDAAALTIFSVAIAAATGSHTLVDSPVLLFLYDASAGICVGLAVAVATLVVRRRLRNPGLETVLGLVTPFVAYAAAEALDASGVLATVAAGLLVGRLTVRSDYRTRLQEAQVWDAVNVMLEAFVFAYVGLQLRLVLDDVRAAGESVSSVVWAGLLILLVVIVVRSLWVAFSSGRRRTFDALRSRVQARRSEQDDRAPAASDPEQLTGREAVVVGWTGMRGVVTVAAAAGIPVTLANGQPFPGRAEIEAVAFIVTVGSLLLEGTTLPGLIRRLGVADHNESELERAEHDKTSAVALDAARAVYREFLASPPEDIDPALLQAITERVEQGRQAEADALQNSISRERFAVVSNELRGRVLEAQRAAILEGLQSSELSDDSAREFLAQLDYQQAALDFNTPMRL
jgi:monovalent cation/hydrogen antiporter